jgi:uncharacterized protein YbjT (DUF2867 family)
MKIVVIGGTGLIGSKLVNILLKRGHEVVAGSPASGVNTLTGEGLASAVAGAQVVVDVANSPSFEEKAVLDFFQTSGRNLLKAEQDAQVQHHVALSIVGTDRLGSNGYFRGKLVQEKLIRESGIPYTIVRSTQFFDFLGGIAQSNTQGSTVHVSPAFVQPIASDDVAEALADFALGEPANDLVEIAGPERVRLADVVERYLSRTHDARTVERDPQAPYFGGILEDDTLVPSQVPRIGQLDFDAWFALPKPAR